jgi:hypothetical protein
VKEDTNFLKDVKNNTEGTKTDESNEEQKRNSEHQKNENRPSDLLYNFGNERKSYNSFGIQPVQTS